MRWAFVIRSTRTRITYMSNLGLIILHAGTAEGWVDGTELVFRAKSSSGDYHNEMNTKRFMEWWTIQLLPNIPDHSIIVLDNASYHNGVVEKIPTKSSLNCKREMQEWLEKECLIQFGEEDSDDSEIDSDSDNDI